MAEREYGRNRGAAASADGATCETAPGILYKQPVETPSAIADLSIPHVWRGRELAGAHERVVATGHAALDAQLPGGGWPVGSLVEILQPQPQQHVWRLLGAGIAQRMREAAGPMLLVQPPYQPFGPALQGQGLQAGQMLWVRAEKPAARLWAAEQALRCADVAAVLAWLPQARGEELRRLHLCAHQHDKLLFVFRGVAARTQASPARVRLLVEGVDRMEVRILKRRGPPLLEPLRLEPHPPRLAALLAARKGRRTAASPQTVTERGSHVLDRTATFSG